MLCVVSVSQYFTGHKLLTYMLDFEILMFYMPLKKSFFIVVTIDDCKIKKNYPHIAENDLKEHKVHLLTSCKFPYQKPTHRAGTSCQSYRSGSWLLEEGREGKSFSENVLLYILILSWYDLKKCMTYIIWACVRIERLMISTLEYLWPTN